MSYVEEGKAIYEEAMSWSDLAPATLAVVDSTMQRARVAPALAGAWSWKGGRYWYTPQTGETLPQLAALYMPANGPLKTGKMWDWWNYLPAEQRARLIAYGDQHHPAKVLGRHPSDTDARAKAAGGLFYAGPLPPEPIWAPVYATATAQSLGLLPPALAPVRITAPAALPITLPSRPAPSGPAPSVSPAPAQRPAPQPASVPAGSRPLTGPTGPTTGPPTPSAAPAAAGIGLVLAAGAALLLMR